MAIPNTSVPAYPSVPNVAGVPPLLRQVDQIQATAVLLVADAASVLGVLGALAGPQWGLFTASGAPAFAAVTSGIAAVVTNLLSGGPGQSIGDVEFRQDNRIATAPQEQGAFLSYNKVSTPFAGRVTYVVSGTRSQRTAFLTQVRALQNSINSFTLVMPEITYASCDIVHHDFRRTAARGLTMLEVGIWVEEVRNVGTAAYSNTAAPSGASQVNGGTVQPQSLTQLQSQASGNVTSGAPGL